MSLSMDLMSGIRDSYLATNLSASEVEMVAAISEEATFGDREMVIEEYDSAVDIFILIEGKLRVTTASGEPIARLEPGAIVGEIALFGFSERSASVESDGESRLIRIPAVKFNALMDAEPQIGVVVLRNVGQTLCKRLRSSNVQLEAVLSAL